MYSTVSNLTPRADKLVKRAKRGNKAVAKKQVASSGASTGASNDGTLAQLFPVKPKAPGLKWTTLDGTPGALPLSDATLRPYNVAKGV